MAGSGTTETLSNASVFPATPPPPKNRPVRTIRSSVDGIVVERALSPGEFILNEGHIITVAEIDPLNVEAFVPVRHYPAITVGMRATVRPEGLPR